MSQRENNNFPALRKLAESKIELEKSKGLRDPLSTYDHELYVHKIELEMQNEELLSAQQKLNNSIEEYAELFDNAPVGYLILDKEGKVINANNTICAAIGKTKNKLIGSHFSVNILSSEVQDDFFRHRNQIMETGGSGELACEILNANTDRIDVLIKSKAVLNEAGKFKHLLVTVSDITTQKEQEKKLASALKKELQLSEMKSQFVTVASHEFRTPLAIAQASIEIIGLHIANQTTDKCETHISRIKSSITRINAILSDLLSVDTIGNNQIEVNKVIADITTIISQVIDAVQPSLLPGQSVNYHHTGRKIVNVDRNILFDILLTLLSNASKYSGEGDVIAISTTNGNGKLVIQISDTGIGIPHSDQPNIFKRFHRGKNAEAIEGAGLGLHIAKGLTLILDGTISFSSKEGSGTTFTIEIPTTGN